MYIVVKSQDLEETLNIEVKRVYTRGCVNDYGLDSKDYKFFQFDCHDRPNDYRLEYRGDVWFRGYLIGKKKDGITPVIECSIQVKN